MPKVKPSAVVDRPRLSPIGLPPVIAPQILTYGQIARILLNTFKYERNNNEAVEKEKAFAKAIADAVNKVKADKDKKTVLKVLLSKYGVTLNDRQIGTIVNLGAITPENISAIFDLFFETSAVEIFTKLEIQAGGAYNQRGGGPLRAALSHAANMIKTTVDGALTTVEAAVAGGINKVADNPLTTVATLSAALRIGGIGQDLSPTLSRIVWDLVSQGPSFLRNAAYNLAAGSVEAATLAGGLASLVGIAGIGVASVLALSRVRALMYKGVKLTSETAKDKLLALATYDPVIDPAVLASVAARGAVPVARAAAGVAARAAAGVAAGARAGAAVVRIKLTRAAAAAAARRAAAVAAAAAAVAPADREAAVVAAAQGNVNALLDEAAAEVPDAVVGAEAEAAAEVPDAVVGAEAEALVADVTAAMRGVVEAAAVGPVVEAAAVGALAEAAMDAAAAVAAAMDAVEPAVAPAAAPGGEPAGAAMVPGGGYRKSHRKAHRKAHRKSHRKAHRKSHRKAHRKSHRKIHKYRLKNKKTRRA